MIDTLKNLLYNKHMYKSRLKYIMLPIGLLSISLVACNEISIIDNKQVNNNIPIMNINMSQVVDVDTINYEDGKSLMPPIFKVGVDHPIVLRIQQRLMSNGFMEEDKASTYYSDNVAEAIKKLQRQLKMTEDGICTKEIYEILMSRNAPTYMVTRGDSGEDIKMLQQTLYELGFLLNESDVSGYFGDKTTTAIRELQKNNKIEETGYVDLNTYKIMYSDGVVGYTINQNSQSSTIRLYQQRLTDLGYYFGDCDGKYSNAFRESVRLYQSMNAQTVDGYINPSTKFSMDSSYARPYIICIGDRSDTIKRIQTQLTLLNYTDSPITGYYGEFTAQSVAYFQKQNNIPITGVVDGITNRAIFSAEAIPANRPIKYVSQFVMQTSDILDRGKQNQFKGNVDDLIRVAMMKLGSKYVWGMKGPKTFDCSGFVYWCLRQIGVEIQYMTTYNWRFTTQFERVEKFDDLKIGDLIIINGHMGIVSDNMTVIDASSSNGKVVHRDLDEWWRERFLMGYRIFSDDNN